MNPLKLCYELDDILPEDSILVGDGGDFVATAANTLRPRGPLCWLDPGAFGTLGVVVWFADSSVPWHVICTCYLSFFTAFSVILLVPLDLQAYGPIVD